MKTLIVEDDFTSRLLLQTFLSKYGECHTAGNGQEAIKAFRMATKQQAPYQLVCMDIIMPGEDGKEVVRSLRAMEEQDGIVSSLGTKIIMTTGVSGTGEVFRSFEALCDAYLSKPIDTGLLLNHLRAYHLID